MSLSEGSVSSSEQQDFWANDAFRSALREEPPSAKLVAKVLATEPELTQDAIVEETLLPRRTVSYALNRLEDAGLALSRRHLGDPRKQIYRLDYDPDA
jgi:DNA-binding MarR family transcriptional regulator